MEESDRPNHRTRLGLAITSTNCDRHPSGWATAPLDLADPFGVAQEAAATAVTSDAAECFLLMLQLLSAPY